MEKSNSQILKRKNLQKDFNITSKLEWASESIYQE